MTKNKNQHQEMTAGSNKISRLWKEIKRRHVHRSLAVYAGSAFVFLEATTIIFPRWGFPDWTIDLVLWLLVMGALLTIVVAWIFDFTSEGVQKTLPVEEIQEGTKKGDSAAWKASTYISLIVIIALIIINLAPSGRGKKYGPIQSLIFLPFENYTGDDELEFLVAGIHSSLINDMGQVSALRVISAGTASTYKNSDYSIPQIASEIGVDAAVEGSLSYVGEDTVCVQLRLIRAFPVEKQLWVEDFRVAKNQILKFYNNITKKISSDINVALSPQEESLLADARTVDPDAYEAFLMGQFYWEKLEKESLEKALEYFELAIELDPEWADPYAGLANAWSLFGTFFGTLPKSVTIPKSHEYLDKALELDPNSAHAHYVKAISSVWAEFDWEQGEKSFLRSLELNPNNALCHAYYCHLLTILRRPEEARIHSEKALKLDPLKPLILTLASNLSPDNPDAIKNLEKALSIDPDFELAMIGLDDIHMNKASDEGDYDKWIEIWYKKVSRRGNWNEEGMTAVMTAFKKDGHIAAIEEMFRMNEKYPDQCFMSVTLKAERYIILGKPDKAMDCLEKGFDDREMFLSYIAANPRLYEPLKNKPRYIALLERMNLGSVLD
ncbi:MAG: hypothetical protein RQ743_06320 [Bacteroidales bacterium]|nr:hypothetical protein [Bacteroidales bacterium]